MSWRPTITVVNIKKRHLFLQKIRNFFHTRNIIEVTTPILGKNTVTSVHIASVQVNVKNRICYLQTSPEYAMKRLLADGAPSIYQICPAFRHEEHGTLHNIEFTMLEWYEINKTYLELMDTVDQFMQTILLTKPAIRLSYTELFKQFVNIDPLQVDIKILQQKLEQFNIENLTILERPILLDLIMSNIIEPCLIGTAPWLVYDYPSFNPMLATIKAQDPTFVERFEIYYDGIELGNAYNECINPDILRTRFSADNHTRKKHNLPEIPIDEEFLQAMSFMPPCSGIAIGLDRLFMCAINSTNIKDAVSFPLLR